MRLYQMADSGVLVSAREYDIAASTAIREGQVVKLSDGLVVAAAAGETGAILGVAAESHSGQADALDPRADGKRIMVVDAPGAIFQCAAPKLTAASGTATTIVAPEGSLAAFTSGDLKGGYVKLIEKVEGSANADAVGQVRRIESYANGTLTVESGGAAAAGDVYAIFPPVGFAKGNLSADGTALVLSATANLPVKVVGHDRDLVRLNIKARKLLLAEIE